jgi:4-hydroxyphenylpyruvate dioxygenase
VTLPSLGIRRVEALHAYVHDLDRSRRLLSDGLDFAEIGESGPQLTRAGRQRSAVFEAGGVRIVCSQPVGEGGRASRWLRKHPEGIGSVVLEVEDAERCFRLLDERGGTPVSDVVEHRDDGGTLRTFSITAPLGDSTLRFVERRGARDLYPGIVRHAAPRGGANALGFREIDHLTANFQTMKPALLWMEHVLGFEPFWDVQFRGHGSGLRSVVMRDPASGLKIASNEPWRPAFKASQINLFNEDHRGDGIQHAALSVADILATVRELRRRGVGLMPTPASYYDALPESLRERGVGRIEEDLAELRDLGILVDGAAPGAYLLQIFLQDAAGLTGDRDAGPFFFEIIQRKGDPGFGEGNFRALFESIERTQQGERRS